MKQVVVVADADTVVKVIRPGAQTGGLRFNCVILLPNSEDDSERFIRWVSEQLSTRLLQGGHVVKVYY